MSVNGDKNVSWWVVISTDSWVNKVHGAFSLRFLTDKKAISADGKGHLHCTT
jgi:hypothetical protein